MSGLIHFCGTESRTSGWFSPGAPAASGATNGSARRDVSTIALRCLTTHAPRQDATGDGLYGLERARGGKFHCDGYYRPRGLMSDTPEQTTGHPERDAPQGIDYFIGNADEFPV